MEPPWSFFKEGLFDGIGHAFDDDGVNYDGAWQGGQERGDPVRQDEAATKFELDSNINESTERPIREQIPHDTEGPFLGQYDGEGTVLFAPQFHVWNAADAPLDDYGGERINIPNSLPSGRSEPLPRQETQPYHNLFAQPGAVTAPTRDTTTTRSSKSKGKGSSSTPGSKGRKASSHTAPSTRSRKSVQGGDFMCNEPGCGKSFPTQLALEKHARYHTPECDRPLQCDSCEKRFLFQKDKERHEFTHAPGQFACDERWCGKRFNRNDHVVRHKKDVHGIKVPPSTDYRILVIPPSPTPAMQDAQTSSMDQNPMLPETHFQQSSEPDLDMRSPDYEMPVVEGGHFEDYDAYSPSLNQMHDFGLVTPPNTGHAHAVCAQHYHPYGIPHYFPASPGTPSRPPRQ